MDVFLFMLFSFGIYHHRFSKYMKMLFEWKSKSVLHILKPQFEGSCLLQLAFCSDSLNFPWIVFPQWFQVITKTQWTFVFSASQDGQEKTKLMKTESRSGGTRLFQATSPTPLPHTPSRLSNLKRNQDQAGGQSAAAIPHKRTFISRHIIKVKS